MCGRTACYLAPNVVSCACKYTDSFGKESEIPWVPAKLQTVQYVPSYNVGPRDNLICIVAGSHFNNTSQRVLCPMMWGMIPPWYKGDHRKHTTATHNGRLDGLRVSKIYGNPLRQGNRCVILINGFYEWQPAKKAGSKQAYYIYKKSTDEDDNQLLFLAGVFDKWKTTEGEAIYSCTVLTTQSNNVLSWLHNRSPVILETEKDIENWLNYKEISAENAVVQLERLVLSTNYIQWHPVASTVNNVKNKDKDCKDPVKPGHEKKYEKDKASIGLMSAWLKSGSMTSKKRSSIDDNDSQNSDSVQKKKTKMFTKD